MTSKDRRRNTSSHNKNISSPSYKSTSLLTRIGKINWSLYRPNRAGAIPYIVEGDTIHFCLGEDALSKQLTDFGGGVAMSETSLEGGLRELREESLDIFEPLLEKDIQDLFVVTSKTMMVFFLPVTLPASTYTKMFDVRKEFEKNLEVTNIFWMTHHQLKGLLEGHHYDGRLKLFYKVRNILQSIYPEIVKSLLKT